ncbi:MAG: phospholipase D family protein [Xanthomonadaceae bacterium]|nr:phospholipase D family protein [Xanthomonadaceae bacterium]MDZ4378317.1 phospholipase D family protein [Xanthomonadaceae bacterium]
MNLRGTLLAGTLLALSACAHLPQARRAEAEAIAADARETQVTCQRDDACAAPSPWREDALTLLAQSTAMAPAHRVLLLESGEDALLARLHLIRAAQRSIELQTYLYTDDDAGRLVLNELIAAARRGVKVRLLLDQLFSVDDIRTLSALAGMHTNFELRLYNPTFGEAQTNALEFGAGIVCCFRRFNRRMHVKALVVDDLLAITGGRNYQNRYYDWDSGYNYRDRDLMVAGSVVSQMRVAFDAFWQHRLSIPIARLHDVARDILSEGAVPDRLPAAKLSRTERSTRLSAMANDPEQLNQRLFAPSLRVGRVEYLVDTPGKPQQLTPSRHGNVSHGLHDLVAQARDSVLLQTPYLVLSKPAKRLFRRLGAGPDQPTIEVSTNSLAATDAWPVYALSHKYKRTYLRELRFQIWEYKPFPTNSMIDLEATGALLPEPAPMGPNLIDVPRRLGSGGERPAMRGSGGKRHGPVPLAHSGVRVGLHAKSLVIDRHIGVVGTHNFDPRSDWFNTECALVVFDDTFARLLEAQIRHDMRPENAWLIARRPKPAIFSGLDYSLGKLFEHLPLFDLWPFRYATSYELDASCRSADGELIAEATLGIADPARSRCWQAVGSFPEVDVPLKGLYTRLMTAFGAGLAPIL